MIKNNPLKNLKQMNKKFILGIIITIIGFYAISTKFFGLADFQTEKSTTLLISRFEFWIFLAIMFFYAKFVEKSSFLQISEQKKKWWFYPLAIVSLLVITTIIMNLIVFAEHKIGMQNNTKIEETLYALLCENKGLMLLTCITAGVTEELLFRGYILSRIKVLFKSDILAVFISALLFGLAHFAYGDFNRMFFPFIIGLIFGTYYVKYRNISVLIICHFIMDFYTLYSQCK
jgi:membrane protease YdiL (CAAX protease family)